MQNKYREKRFSRCCVSYCQIPAWIYCSNQHWF